jgi:hypothetical protein
VRRETNTYQNENQQHQSNRPGHRRAITASSSAFADPRARTMSSKYVKTIQASLKSGITVIYGHESKHVSTPNATTQQRERLSPKRVASTAPKPEPLVSASPAPVKTATSHLVSYGDGSLTIDKD